MGGTAPVAPVPPAAHEIHIEYKGLWLEHIYQSVYILQRRMMVWPLPPFRLQIGIGLLVTLCVMNTLSGKR